MHCSRIVVRLCGGWHSSGVMHDLLASSHNVAPSTFVRLRDKGGGGLSSRVPRTR